MCGYTVGVAAVQIVADSLNVSLAHSFKSRMGFLRSFVHLIGSVSSHSHDSGTVFHRVFRDMTVEVLLGVSHANNTIRTEAINLLQAMASASVVSLEDLIVLLLPGLGSPDPAWIAATLMALVALLKSHGDLMPSELLNRIVVIALTLFKDPDKQVFKCALAFVRVSLCLKT